MATFTDRRGQLVLTRRALERVRLRTAAGEVIWVTVADIDRTKVRIAFEAPQSVEIYREELLPPATE